ncbi:MAG: AI-2E family transporter [Enhydrobacter sp.]|nr:AI-2E family transporter [Enhydrobacter sp.]
MTTKGGRSPAAGAVDATPSQAAPASLLAAMVVVLAVALGLALALAWYNVASLLVLFAGLLFAVSMDACTIGLGRLLPISRSWRFALVAIALGIVAALAVACGFARLPEQARSTMCVIDAQLATIQAYLAPYGIELFGPEGKADPFRLVAEPGRLFGHVHKAVAGAYAVSINSIVVVCLGLFLAASPGGYREGLLRLLPIARRARMREAMNEMRRVLHSWLVGQLVRNSILAVTMATALHFLRLPGAALLGLMAGAANFILYLGSLIAAFAVALVAMPLGHSTLIWVMAVYFSIQTIEGYVSAPLIQRGAVNIPPAWTLLAIVVCGAMFGVMGVALAAPLLAVGRVAVQRLYVEDWLQDRQ